jgi:hypothetical protein
MLPGSYQLPAGVLLILVGLVACFAGYRFFRVVLTVYGFVLGALLATTLVHPAGAIALLAVIAVGGLLGAAILWFGYMVGVALAGGAFGVVVVRAAWAAWKGGEPGVLAAAFAAVAGAAIAVAVQKQVVIVATAFVGAETALAGLGAFLARGGGRPGLDEGWIGRLRFPSPGRTWAFVAWLALGVLGAIVQFRGGVPRRFGGRAAKKAN